MKLVAALLVGACLLAIAKSSPVSSESESKAQPGIPTTLAEEEKLQISQDEQHQAENLLARDKRHKKKVVIINQYYDRPGRYHGWQHHGGGGYYGYGCRGCGGGYYYPGGGYNNYGGYNYYPGGGYYNGHKGHGKFG